MIGLRKWLFRALAVAAFALPAMSGPAGPQTNASPSPGGATIEFRALAKSNYWAAQSRYTNQPPEPQHAWQFARACFDLGDYATNSSERAELAEQGITACRQLLARFPNLAAAHYYLGMNLGQLARTRGIGALKLVDEMERVFTRTRQLDPHFDYAGSDRNLGLLYRDAPSFGSIGNRSKAKHHLLRAAVLAPQYPDNRLNLIEAFLKWSDANSARRELKALEEIWPNARSTLTGEAWAAGWFDWEKRRNEARKKLAEPSKTLQSPRQKS